MAIFPLPGGGLTAHNGAYAASRAAIGKKSCLYGCGKCYFPNDGIDCSQTDKGVVQWWGRTDNEDAEGWLFDVHYQ